MNYLLLHSACMKISEAIVKLMDDAGENPYSLAPKIRVPQPTIFRLISGITQEPKPSTIAKFAKFFGVDADCLYRGEIVKKGQLNTIYQAQLPGPTHHHKDPIIEAICEGLDALDEDTRGDLLIDFRAMVDKERRRLKKQKAA